MNCALYNNPHVFLLSDTQIVRESFLEDVNNMLNNGEIPNLFEKEHMNDVVEQMKDQNKNDREYKNLSDNLVFLDF